MEMRELLLLDWLAGETYAELLENLVIDLGEHDGRVNLTAAELRELLKGAAAVVVGLREYAECHEDFIGMKARIVTSEIFHLGLLYGFNHSLRDELDIVVNACKVFGGIEDKCCRRAEKLAGLAGNDSAISEFDGGARLAALPATLLCRHGDLAIVGGYLCLLEEKLYLLYLGFIVCTVSELIRGIVIAAYNLVLGGLAAGIVIADTETNHIDAHICRRLIGVAAVDTLEESVEDRENLNITVVVDGNLIVGLKVEGVNHIDIVEVGRSCLIGDVDRMLQRERPYGESLELGIASLDAALVLVVKLREADSHFAAAGAWGGNDDERTGSLDVIVLAEAIVTGNKGNVVRIAVDEVVYVGLDAHALKAHTEIISGMLSVVMSNDYAAYHKAARDELATQAEDILVVGDTEVGAHLILYYILSADNDYNLYLVADFAEHTKLRVRLKAWKNATGVVIVEEFATEFEVEFALELLDAFLDVL
jgi:hypothetical protein